ncbi:Glycosyltransferase Family 1 protein, partial [Gigaspora rosea]
MLEILKILMDRGYNVTLISRGNYTSQSLNYRSIPQIIFDNDQFDIQNSSNSVNASKNSNESKFDETKTSIENDSHSKSDQSNVHICTDIDNEFIDLSQNALLSLIRVAIKSYVPSYIYNIFKQPIEEYTVDAIKSYVPFYNIYKQSAEELNADLFFCDYSINYPCFDIAWKLGKPAVGIFSDLYNIASSPYKADPVLGCRANMENESFYHRFKCTIITPLMQDWRSMDFLRALNIQRASIGIDPHWDMKGRISNLLMLSNNFFGFEIPSSDSPLHQEIGPIMPDNFPALTPVLDKFLIAHPRTIYFALGTNAILSPQNVVTILKSFLTLIVQDVIDGVIWSTTKTDPLESLSLTNSSVQISAILNNEHPHIHITKFSPQFAILSHENTKLFLSHGGAASSHESMYNAKPMLVLPIRGDQPRNAEMLELAGMALKLSKTDLKVDDIITKVKRLLNEESFKKNAERLQFLAKVNSKRKYRAADLIEIVL